MSWGKPLGNGVSLRHLEDKLKEYEQKLVKYKAWNKQVYAHVISFETIDWANNKDSDIEKEILDEIDAHIIKTCLSNLNFT